MDDKFLLVLFYSASGSVKNLAHAISDGAEEHGLKVKIRTVPKVSSNTEKTNEFQGFLGWLGGSLAAMMAPRRSKMAPRRPKMAPGRSQDGQIWLEDAFKTRSDAPKMVENAKSVEI